MLGMIDYALPLRAIGQALETLNIQSFELEPIDGAFRVRGTLTGTNAESAGERLTADNLNAVWGKISDFNLEGRSRQSATVHAPIELRYTPEDVERLEQQGRIKRVDPHRLPDTSSLPQVLRCVGTYLNQKRARLLKLSRDDESISVEYETSLGSQHKETLVMAELYDLWVRMYLQRAERAS